MTERLALAPASSWVAPELSVCDGDDRLTFRIQDAFNFHGYDAAGGVVLGFRLLQRAAALLSPDALPERRGFSLFTSFPGLGARDCFELVTRMVSGGRFRLDTGFEDTVAQPGVEGRFHFDFGYDGRRVVLAPVEGYPVPEFIALGKASKRPGFTAEQQLAWRNAKITLANTLLRASADQVIRVIG